MNEAEVRLHKKQGLTSSEYSSIHSWLKKEFGIADRCSNNECGNKSKTFDWALIQGKKYAYERDNFIMLCRSCHIKYDYSPNRGINGGHNKGNSRYGVKIKQYSLDGILLMEWNTSTEIEKELLISHSNVCACIRGERKTAGGFKWKI